MKKVWLALFLVTWTLATYATWLIATGVVQVNMARAECLQDVKKVGKEKARVLLERLERRQ